MTNFRDHGIKIPNESKGQYHTTCPECSHTRKKSSEACLSVNADDGTWYCHHCGWSGGLKKSNQIERSIPNFNEIYKAAKVIESKNDILRKSLVSYFAGRSISEKTLNMASVTLEVDQYGVEQIAFPFLYDGNVVNIKYRSKDKTFKQTKNGFRTFYNIDSISGSKVAIITEGEIDTLSFIESGFHFVCSVPDGALNPDAKNISSKMTFLDNSADKFDQCEMIYLALDGDAPGRRMLEELARRLGKERCAVITYPDGCKDANDVLVKYGREGVKDLIKTAVEFPIEGVKFLNESTDRVLDIFINGFPEGVVTQEWKEFDKLIKWFLGQLTVVTGIPSHGKSNFVDNLIVHLARNNGWKTAVFSPENPTHEMWVIRLLEIATGQSFFGSSRIEIEKIKPMIDTLSKYFFLINPSEEFTLDIVLATMRSLIRKHGVNVLVIDPWNNLEVRSKAGESETSYTARILVKLRTFARQMGVHIILIAHPRKMSKLLDGTYEIPTAYDISGSAHFYNVADNIMSVYREFLSEDSDRSTTHVHIQKVKTKYTGQLGCAKFSYDKMTQKFSETI
jgi:twinkle protein